MLLTIYNLSREFKFKFCFCFFFIWFVKNCLWSGDLDKFLLTFITIFWSMKWSFFVYEMMDWLWLCLLKLVIERNDFNWCLRFSFDLWLAIEGKLLTSSLKSFFFLCILFHFIICIDLSSSANRFCYTVIWFFVALFL